MNQNLGGLLAQLSPSAPSENTAVGGGAINGDAIIAGLYSSGGPDLAALPCAARWLFELSVNAFDAVVHAWMSELPIEGETLRFGRKVLAAPDRPAADKAAADRGDSDTRIVLEAAYKVRREIDRLRGLLRFSPDEAGVYIARCAPNHYLLPALAEHFTRRFGDTPWAIIDEKRGLSTGRAAPAPASAAADPWEELWKHYHQTINNESRNNPALQRQFIPNRYRKYLPEFNVP